MGHAYKEHAQNDRHDPQSGGRVPALRWLEGGHAVRYGLRPGHGAAAPRKRAQHQEDQGDRSELGLLRDLLYRKGVETAGEPSDSADHHQATAEENEGVGGEREYPPRLAEPPKIGQGDQRHYRQRDEEPVGKHAGKRGGHCRHARGDADRNGHDVVDHQRGGGDHPREPPEVLGAHDVGAAAGRIGVDGLLVGERHDRQKARHREGDPEREMQQGHPDAGPHENDEYLLSGVCRRGDRIRREDRKSDQFGEPCLVLLVRRDRLTDEYSFDQLCGSSHVIVSVLSPSCADSSTQP